MNSFKELISFLKTLILALLFAGIIRSFWFEPFHIPSGSMKPGLLVGDYIIVSKYSYGYSRYSFPLGFDLFEDRKFFKEGDVKRGDPAVFRLPSNPSINYIKRIVGLPGDEIQVRDGALYVNEEKIKKVAKGHFSDDLGPGDIVKIKKFTETIEEKSFEVLDMVDDSKVDNTGIFKVPKGHYFAMGDNRDNSQDSRFLSEVGYIPEQNLIGKARFIFFSIDGPFWKFWQIPDSVRKERILQKIN